MPEHGFATQRAAGGPRNEQRDAALRTVERHGDRLQDDAGERLESLVRRDDSQQPGVQVPRRCRRRELPDGVREDARRSGHGASEVFAGGGRRGAERGRRPGGTRDVDRRRRGRRVRAPVHARPVDPARLGRRAEPDPRTCRASRLSRRTSGAASRRMASRPATWARRLTRNGRFADAGAAGRDVCAVADVRAVLDRARPRHAAAASGSLFGSSRTHATRWTRPRSTPGRARRSRAVSSRT